MAKSSLKNEVFDNSLCSKDCKKNNDSLNSKITDLTDKLFDANNLIYHYKLALTQVESRLVEYKEREVKYYEKIRTLEFHNESNNECIEILKKKLENLKLEKDGVDGKLAGLLKASKDLDNLIESQRSDKNKDGLGYSVVPPPPAQLYISLKKDLSWTSLPECADDTVTDYSRPSPTVESTSRDDQNRNSSASKNGETTDSILSKPAVKFVKTAKRSTTNKVETVKKPSVKYAEMHKRTTKKPNVRGNQRNWNNLKSHQLGPNFVMKKKACFNCGDFSHLAYECRKRVKRELLALRIKLMRVSNPDLLLTDHTDLQDYSVQQSPCLTRQKILSQFQQVKLKTLKLEKVGVDGKLAGLLKASKDLDNLIESQRLDKNKDGLGYSAIPLPPAQLYLSLKKDLSWTGLPECDDDIVTDYSRTLPTIESTSGDDQNKNSSASENGESTDSNLSKHAVKFMKPAERSTTNKVETVKKPSVKYAEMYKRTTKKPNVRGNKRNWNNLKSHQFGPNFVMKKKACFNCGDFSHLAYDCRKRVKKGTSRSQNKTHESFKSRPVAHRPYRPLVRQVRTNMNDARPNKTTFNKQAHSYANRPFS
nr:ubiquitin hydrolase [Tanacetum cinerariifolium]